MLKILKNYDLVVPKKYDRLSFELGMTRRIFRLTRKWITFKEIYSILKNMLFNKEHSISKMDFFQIFFKLFTLLADLNDMISYMMHLRILPHEKNPEFMKRTLNFYFFECIIWLGLHTMQYFEMLYKRNYSQKVKNNEKMPT